MTTGIKKYGKRLIAPNRVHEYGAYAFRNLKSGVPGPVHLDFPGEVARARFTDASNLTDFYAKAKYRTETRPHPSSKDVALAIDMINKAERPIIVAGQGVFQRGACDALQAAAEKNEIAVVTSGPMRGHFPDDHRLSASFISRRVDERRPGGFCRSILHAESGRIPVQRGCQDHPDSPRAGGSGPQLAAGSRHRQ